MYPINNNLFHLQAFSNQFVGAYTSLAGIDLLGLRSACDPYSILLSEAAFADSYRFSPYDEAIWPYSFGPFSEAWGPNGFGLGAAELAASNGIKFAVTSASPITPYGLTIISENVYEGPLAISGSIPFLGAVALEGALPTIGGGAVNYGCGNGEVDIITEELAELDCYGDPFFDDLARPNLELVRPYVYESLFGPYGYDELVGPYGYGHNGVVGPNYGRYGPYGYNDLYY